jgi:hypothetical protein
MIVVLLSAVFLTGAALVMRPISGAASPIAPKKNLANATTGTDDFSESQIEQAEIGLALSPVPLSQVGIGRGRIQVGLGSYLVNTGGCNDCHTNPSYLDGHDPFKGQPEQINAAGFLAGGTEFGPFTSRNLTPDPDEGNLPAGLTLDQFKLVMRTGIDLDKAHPQMGPLLQVMPWPVFGKKTDQELEAVYDYLLHIPHVETAKPKT